MTVRYLWQLPSWPELRWDDAVLPGPLSEAYAAHGRLLGGGVVGPRA